VNRCPITYELTESTYSPAGLRILSPGLTELNIFPYSAEEQVREAAQRASKMSVQGVQPKLSAVLNLKQKVFEIVDKNGQYILKPRNYIYPELPENEDLSMKMAKLAGIETPHHGLIYSKDGTMTYFIKRFDRIGRNRKLPLEDFAQLTGNSRDTKYDSSMEKVAGVIERFCTFPALEKTKLFRLTLFNFLIGNEDMHLKNFSLITRGNKVELSPAYDLLNSSIALDNPAEEIALPLGGKRRRLTARLLIDYYGKERLGLTEKVIRGIIEKITIAFPGWENLIDTCFLSGNMKVKYRELLNQRKQVLGI
jgi:serine/threonine-protein kinase HipA